MTIVPQGIKIVALVTNYADLGKFAVFTLYIWGSDRI